MPGRPPARSDAVDVASGGTTGGVRIALLPGGSVSGHVWDDHHAPLAGVDVRFDALSSVVDSTASAKTDDGGGYRLDGAPAGPFTMRVQKDGYRVRLISGLRVDPKGTLAQDVTLTALDGGGGLELGGIGASLRPTREGVAFASVGEGDPAERAGLRGGDRIVRIDGEDATGMSLADVLQRLRGPVGTTVGVAVERPKSGETIEVVVVRAAIVR
jgi:membrane-associated protease RseP (regulator of RpoE activity)